MKELFEFIGFQELLEPIAPTDFLLYLRLGLISKDYFGVGVEIHLLGH